MCRWGMLLGRNDYDGDNEQIGRVGISHLSFDFREKVTNEGSFKTLIVFSTKIAFCLVFCTKLRPLENQIKNNSKYATYALEVKNLLWKAFDFVLESIFFYRNLAASSPEQELSLGKLFEFVLVD